MGSVSMNTSFWVANVQRLPWKMSMFYISMLSASTAVAITVLQQICFTIFASWYVSPWIMLTTVHGHYYEHRSSMGEIRS
jgi:hypothetical protein